MAIVVRPVAPEDHAPWSDLWDGYQAFYKISVPPDVSALTWSRFFEPGEPMHALVAEVDGSIGGLAHYLYHRSTTSVAPVCYLRDLFTRADLRGSGIGRALIEAVAREAKALGVTEFYWLTHETNATAMALYNKLATRTGFVHYGCAIPG